MVIPDAEKPPLVGIITGAGSGIGAAIAAELGRLGAQLALSDLPGRDRDLDRVAMTVSEAGGDAITAPADVRDFDEVSALARRVVEHFGRIDALFANAGISEQSTASRADPAVWRTVVETNLLGVAFCVRAVLPHMLQQNRGHIVITASTAGREIYAGEPMYVASKWGVVGFGQALRKELEKSGVRVALVEPDVVDTPLTRANPSHADRLEAGRALRPADVARVVAFIVSQPEHVAVNEILLRPQFPQWEPPLGYRVRLKVRRALRR